MLSAKTCDNGVGLLDGLVWCRVALRLKASTSVFIFRGLDKDTVEQLYGHCCGEKA